MFTASPKRADPAPGPRPAPELARYDRRADRTRHPAPLTAARHAGRGAGRAGRGRWTATASCIRHPGPATRPWPTPTTWRSCTPSGPPRPPRPASSATRTCSWPACRPATAGNPATRRSGCGGPCAPPNWPAWTPPVSWPPRSPNGTWPDPATSPPSSTPASATASAPWSRSRRGPWSAQVPALADPERRAYVAEIAALMDARKDRIGEHAADHAPPWAIAALGPVPGHPLDRLDWQQRAAAIGAWRELSGYDHPADPIGPEPVAAAPDLRAAWHEALAALGPADGPDVRGMPDGRLLHLRDTYPVETAWAPRYVGDELRQVRAAAWDARLAACAPPPRPAPPPSAATSPAAAQQQAWPPATGPCSDAYREREAVFAADDGRPRRLGRRHPRPAPPGRRRRRRTPPPPPRPALPAAALRRTRARHPRPARRAHPDPGAADPGDRTSGSRTWPPGTGPSPTSWPTGRA